MRASTMAAPMIATLWKPMMPTIHLSVSALAASILAESAPNERLYRGSIMETAKRHLSM
jgi:hypothetical protein